MLSLKTRLQGIAAPFESVSALPAPGLGAARTAGAGIFGEGFGAADKEP